MCAPGMADVPGGARRPQPGGTAVTSVTPAGSAYVPASTCPVLSRFVRAEPIQSWRRRGGRPAVGGAGRGPVTGNPAKRTRYGDAPETQVVPKRSLILAPCATGTERAAW